MKLFKKIFNLSYVLYFIIIFTITITKYIAYDEQPSNMRMMIIIIMAIDLSRMFNNKQNN